MASSAMQDSPWREFLLCDKYKEIILMDMQKAFSLEGKVDGGMLACFGKQP